MSWIEQAACEGTELDLWFDPERKDESLAYCNVCPVREQCLEDAMERRAADGVTGGTIPEERRRLARNRGIHHWPWPSPAYEPVQRNCTVEWCREKPYAKGMCNAHYRQVRKHGVATLPRSFETEQDRADAMWTVRRIAADHSVSADEVMSDSMRRDVVGARHEVMVELVARGWSYAGVGRLLSKHHTTVMAALRKVAA